MLPFIARARAAGVRLPAPLPAPTRQDSKGSGPAQGKSRGRFGSAPPSRAGRRPEALHNSGMPNIASILKEEIARVARKEVRSEIAALKKSVTTHRAEIAALKRRAQALEQQLRRVAKASAKPKAVVADDATAPSLRFRAAGLASQRKRLGLSASECGMLVGASGQSIYNWESGKARPQAKHLVALATLRTMGKKEAAARLGALQEAD
jgi:DNA-binding transcriptional regulator YiaG